MSVTVVLDDKLAGQLKPKADALRVSVGDFAVRILQEAASRPGESNTWSKINSRRLDLIALEYSQGLSTEEAQELDTLQEAVAKASEPEDRQLLKALTARERRAASSSGTSP